VPSKRTGLDGLTALRNIVLEYREKIRAYEAMIKEFEAEIADIEAQRAREAAQIQARRDAKQKRASINL